MILHGDCLEQMRAMEDNSVDSVVSDPPYGISFMGKKWDYDVPKVEVWKEAMRVLKPGGHILVACGTRTQHRMAVNIEDAGFEIRDIVAWVYGSGFPKSLNIGKAVDKLQGNEREVIGKKTGGAYDSKTNLGYNEFQDKHIRKIKKYDFDKITKGNSPYEGWGTALKPAMELWTLARKPLSEKTIAETVLKWGTGGINIDGSRVGTEKRLNSGGRTGKNPYQSEDNNLNGENNIKTEVTGRFPANLIHDGSDEVVGLFPETSKGWAKATEGKAKGKGSMFKQGGVNPNRYDMGGKTAARFFYCAKASKKERNEGCEGLEEKELNDSKNKGNLMGSEWIIDPRHKDGGYNSAVRKPTANHHPTVKPIKLMQYLARLITPKGGTVLDPYMGSGTTGIACKKEGFEFIGIELDKDYFEIAKARIEKLEHQHELF